MRDRNPTSTLRSGLSRKSDLDPAAPLGFGHPDLSAVQFHGPAGDGEAEARAAVALVARGGALVEALEDLVPLGLRDAGALVEDFEDERLGVGAAPGEHGDATV